MVEPATAGETDGMARDWATIWQSELAALAADREASEHWQALLAAWLSFVAPADASGISGTGPASRPEAAAAAPDAGTPALSRLAELERQCAALREQLGRLA